MTIKGKNSRFIKECITSFSMLTIAIIGLVVFIPVVMESMMYSPTNLMMDTCPAEATTISLPTCSVAEVAEAAEAAEATKPKNESIKDSYINRCCNENECLVDHFICGTIFEILVSRRDIMMSFRDVTELCDRQLIVIPWQEVDVVWYCPKNMLIS